MSKHPKERLAKRCLSISIRTVLFGAGLLPMSVWAQGISGHAIDQKNDALERLSGYYQALPHTDARCQGRWTYPTPDRSSLAKQLGADNDTNSIPKHGSYHAQADYGYYDNDAYAELSGNVILEQNGQQVLADKITFNPKTGDSRAMGRVLFNDNPNHPDGNQNHHKHPQSKHDAPNAGMIGIASELNYNANTQTANAKDVAFASIAIGAHGHAKHMQKLSNGEYKMDEVMFTTCPPTQRKWHLDADSIEIDTKTGRAIAKNSTLKIKDTPVFYLPYFNFPIDDRRASGFLLPTAGMNSSGGLKVTAPYYLNLAPNFDATLNPTLFNNRNPMLGAEFRYLTKNYGSGILDVSYLPNDRKHGDTNRHHVFYDHQWRAKHINNLTAHAIYRHVSDSDYLSDFDALGLKNNPLNLPRRIGVNYYNEYLTADLRAETFQTLSGKNSDGSPIQDKDKPYSRLPQLTINFILPKSTTTMGKHWKIPSSFDRFDITARHNSGYFKKTIASDSTTEHSGVRVYNQLTASYPILKNWGYFTPTISLHHLYASYDKDSLVARGIDKTEGHHSVFVPQLSFDTAAFFEKSGSPFGWFDKKWGGYQVLSPRLKYNHTPYKDQHDIPNFETAFAAINYDQLLADSWFLGDDRIQDLHAITPAINYRYVDQNGQTRFDGSMAQQFYLSDLKVGLDDSQKHADKSSGMAWKISTQPKDDLWIDTDGSFTPNHHLNHFTAQIRYQPSERSLYGIGLINRKHNHAFGQLPLQAYTASAIFPINNRWRLLSQVQFDRRNDRLLDALVGINYEDCCYGLSVYARRYRNSLSPDIKANHAIMAEIRLNGITDSSRLSRLMSDKVVGYDATQDAWQKPINK